MNSTNLPEKWALIELGLLGKPACDSLVGGPFGSDLTTADYQADPGVPVIRGANLGGETGRFSDDRFVFVSERKAHSLARNTATPGDIVFTQRGTLGQVAVIPDTARFSKYIVSQSQMRLTPDPAKIERRYLFHYYRGARAQAYLSARTLATGVPHINLGILRTLPVVCPPLDEQRRIADVLDRTDALRVMRRGALTLLDTLAEAVFIDLFGNPLTNPIGWPTVCLRDMLAMPLRNGVSPSNGSTVAGQVLTLSAVTGAAFDAASRKPCHFRRVPPSNQTVDRRDLLICRGNGNLGLVGKGRFPTVNLSDVAFPDTVIAARIAPAVMDRTVLEHVWNSSTVRRQIETLARTTNGTFKVNQAMLESVVVIAPPLVLQQKFALRVGAIERLKTAHRASLAQMDALFASLQHRAFRGEL